MKKYRVNVNGTNYEIALEIINEEAATSNIATPVQTAPVVATPVASPSATATGVTTAPKVSANDLKINSPMPGTILSVNVSNSTPVKKGDVLFILEAMKMENEILSPKDGIVASVHVNKGASVDSSALLCVIQ